MDPLGSRTVACFRRLCGRDRSVCGRHLGAKASGRTATASGERLHSPREGILITDENGLIVDVSEAFSHVTGYAREEVLGRS